MFTKMDQRQFRTLQILEEIGNDSSPSQRELSRKLNISLGLVNSFLKRLAQKGYCKINTIPKNRVSYLLTPKGMTEKTRLTYEYIQSSIRFYRNSRQKVKKMFKELRHKGVEQIAFYGVSELAEISYLYMQEASIQLSAVIDNDHCGKSFLKKVVIGSDQMAETFFDVILITDILEPLETHEKIRSYGIPKNKIVMI